MRKWIGWGIVGVIALVVITGDDERPREPVKQQGASSAEERPQPKPKRRAKRPRRPQEVPKVKGARLDVAEDLLDEKRLRHKEIGGGALGVVDRSAWEVCETRPKAETRTKATVKLIVERPGECGGGDSGLGGLFESDVKAKTVRSIPIGTKKRIVRAKLGKPSSDQEFESKGDSGFDDECWYYTDEDFSEWQLCFANGKLTSRNKY